MADVANTEREQRVVDDILAIPALLGFVCPPVAIGATAVKALVDLGFALYLSEIKRRAVEIQAAQAAGEAAGRASAVTTALARERAVSLTCGGALPGRAARVFHGADCAAHAGCGKEIERT